MEGVRNMPFVDIVYAQLPREIKDNLSPEQWNLAQRDIIEEGKPVPETTEYVNVKNGLRHRYERGERAKGPLLPAYDLSGARGGDDTQFHTSP